jgi:hypothetical protein
MARGRKPIGKHAMTAAERQARYRARRAYKLGLIKAGISKLTRVQIKHHRAERWQQEYDTAVALAHIFYVDQPQRLRDRLAELRRMAAEFHRAPGKVSRLSLWYGDPTASAMATLSQRWERRFPGTLLPAGWRLDPLRLLAPLWQKPEAGE